MIIMLHYIKSIKRKWLHCDTAWEKICAKMPNFKTSENHIQKEHSNHANVPTNLFFQRKKKNKILLVSFVSECKNKNILFISPGKITT